MLTTDPISERFERLEVAGRGGMSTVYRARDHVTNALVAIKELLDTETDSVRRFLNEVRTLEEIDHPHVVRHVAHGVAGNGSPYLVMEWLDGVNLARRLSTERLGVQETVDLGRRVASALGMAHRRGIVHRDIKPSNIFLPNGDVQNVKVLDFGIARFEKATTFITKTGMLMGTPGYMAPEQAKGERPALDARADVFSLGCVLFECLTGKPAFHASHLIASLAKLLLDKPPRIREFRPDVPEALDDLIQRMLSKNPADRPANGDAVIEELADFETWENKAPMPVAMPAESLTHGEKRLVSMVVVVPPTVVALPAETVENEGDNATVRNTVRPDKRMVEVRRAAEMFGARLEVIANGMLIAMLVGSGPATDQAAIAARCALRMHWLLPECPIVLLTRRGESTGQFRVGEVFDHAGALLQTVQAADSEAVVAIDEVTQALLDVRFDVRSERGLFVLRGERYIGVEARTLLGKPSPFVGRDRELRHLLDLVNEAIDEQKASVILVSGDAGIGKSRLRFEFMQRLRISQPHLRLVLGRGDSISAGSAFSLIASAFRSKLGIALDEPVEDRRNKLVTRVAQNFSGNDLWRVSGFLGEMLGIPFADDTDPRVRAARQNPAIMADQIQTAYVDFARATAASVPILVVLEDLQWGDGPSIKLFDAALRELADSPYLIVAFARPEVHEVFPKVWAARNVHTIPLTGLTRRSAETLVKTMLGDTAQGRTIGNIVDRAAGNAFYLEELIRAVSEGHGETLPETVLGMVEARISALDSNTRRFLRAASIFGESFWSQGLGEVLHDEHADDTAVHLERLCRLELVCRRGTSRFLGESEFGFRHALVREAAYAMLTDYDRTVGHDRAGQWLLRVGEQDSMVLAGHFERGTMRSNAAIHYARASEQAMCGADFPTAIARAERGISCGAEGAANATLRYVLSSAYMLTAQYAKAYENARLLLADPSAGNLGRARAIGYSVSNAIILGKLDVFGDLVSEILAIEPGPEEAAIVAHALYMPFIMLVVAGKLVDAVPCLRRLDQLAAQYGDDSLLLARAEVARMSWDRESENDLWRAREHNLAAVRRFEEVRARENLAIYNAHLGLSHLQLGAFADAETVLDDVLTTHDAGDLARMYAMHYKSLLFVETGRFDEAMGLATSLAKDALQANDFVLLWCAQLSTVNVLIARDKLDEADQVLDGLGEANAFLPFLRARLLSLQSEIRRRQGRTDEAVRAAADSVTAGRAGPRYNYGEDPFSLRHALALHDAGDLENARRVIREGRDDLLLCAAKIPDEAIRRAYLESIGWHAQTLELAHEWLMD